MEVAPQRHRQHDMQADRIAVVKGRFRTRDEGFTLHANHLEFPDLLPVDETKPLELRLMERRATLAVTRDLRAVLERHQGPTEVRMRLERPGMARVFRLRNQVQISSALFGELKSLLGPSALV